MRRTIAVVAAVVAGLLAAAAPAGAQAIDPAYEASNNVKQHERQAEYNAPGYRDQMTRRVAESYAEAVAILAEDRERDFSGNLCWQHNDGCAGDTRFYRWQEDGHGLRLPVLWTARNGATISGHVWATRAGPAVRPAVVITTGSVQAPEELYAAFATVLAKAGYVVLTWDVQGQGRSDTYGEGADRNEGVPSQNGQPFFDGTEDAIDFLLSSPAAPFRPRRSCTTGTSHADKHERRVREGRNAPFNPLHHLVDPRRVGLAGHSLGAGGVSYVGQLDPRVDAVVAWDNLRASDTGQAMNRPECPSGSSPRPLSVPLRVPSMGQAADYPLTNPAPMVQPPARDARNGAFTRFRGRGIDTMQVNVRGGTHFEWAYIPNVAFGATLRGMDMAAWYTLAWLDRHVRGGDPTALRRLLTTRWLDDPPGRAVDRTPGGADGNLFSRYLDSPVAIGGDGGRRIDCPDLRRGVAGCAALGPDGTHRGPWSYAEVAFTPDRAAGGGGGGGGAGGGRGPFGTPAGGGRGEQRVALEAPALVSDVERRAAVPVRVRPRGGDAALVDRYEVQVATAGRERWRAVEGDEDGRATLTRVRPGLAYRLRARAIERGGRRGPWSATVTSVVPADDSRGRGRPRYSRGWRRAPSREAWLGSLRVATRPGKSLRRRFRGREIVVLGRRSPRGARAVVTVDGRRVAVRTRARRVRHRAVLARIAVAGRGVHTLTVEYAGRPGRRLEIDGFGLVP